jgi:hypothetical protein
MFTTSEDSSLLKQLTDPTSLKVEPADYPYPISWYVLAI